MPRRFWGERHQFVTVVLLSFAQVGGHGAQIIVELFGVFFSDSPDFFNNWIVTHG
jgi:hypothetical protein